MKQHFSTLDLTKMALLTALICISSYITIPIPFSPVSLTAQTLIINLIALLLPPGQAAFTVGAFILLGVAGLPVFSGGTAGIGRLLGPSGGYIISWLFAVVIMSLLKGRKYHFFRYCAVTILAGMTTIYLIGSIYMKFITGMDWSGVLTAAVLPFIPLDIFKCIAASLLAGPIQTSLAGMKAAR